jgi:hypothetical protein
MNRLLTYTGMGLLLLTANINDTYSYSTPKTIQYYKNLHSRNNQNIIIVKPIKQRRIITPLENQLDDINKTEQELERIRGCVLFPWEFFDK